MEIRDWRDFYQSIGDWRPLRGDSTEDEVLKCWIQLGLIRITVIVKFLIQYLC